jgi:dTDP-4-amino-4,6-dideoxygalactose transaminase
LPQSEAAANETLALPIYPELTQQQLQYVADQVVGFLGQSESAGAGKTHAMAGKS